MNNDKNIHRSTSRVIDILELIANNPSKYNLTEVCQLTNSPKSSLYPILYTLTARNFLALDANSRYYISYGAYQVGNSFLTQLDFLGEVEKILTNLTQVCSETSHFAMLADSDVLYLKKIDSPEFIRTTSQVGNRMPAYGTALGKALLIDCEMPDLKRLYTKPLTAITPHTITNLNVLLEQIHEARRTGFTYEIEESNEHIRCYAMPVRQNSRIVAAISVAIPIFRYNEEKGTLVKSLLLNAQKKIETLLNSTAINLNELT